jgi:hypothetical protein
MSSLSGIWGRSSTLAAQKNPVNRGRIFWFSRLLPGQGEAGNGVRENDLNRGFLLDSQAIGIIHPVASFRVNLALLGSGSVWSSADEFQERLPGQENPEDDHRNQRDDAPGYGAMQKVVQERPTEESGEHHAGD